MFLLVGSGRLGLVIVASGRLKCKSTLQAPLKNLADGPVYLLWTC